MKLRWIAPSLVWLLTLPVALANDELVVHEWGYFVENGSRSAIEILESMPPEVPNFRSWSRYGGRFRSLEARGDLDLESRPVSLGPDDAASSRRWGRSGATSEAAVRWMLEQRYAPRPRSASSEPYIYFYSDRATEVDVSIRFPGGAPTFWWPVARVSGDEAGSMLEWNDVAVLPRGARVSPKPWRSDRALRLGLDRARQTGSSPLKVGNVSDKYLFYEGTISTDAILPRHLSWDGWHLANLSAEPITDVLVFAPGSDRPVRIERILPGTEAVVAVGAAGDEVWDEARLATHLGTTGLFADEAAAMAASVWGTGFVKEAGTKVLYRVPREAYDQLYPAKIDPTPDTFLRVGLVVSYDLDHALRGLLDKIGGTYLRHPTIRDGLVEQVREVVACRLDRLEPLTETMREALALEASEMGALRKRIAETARKAPGREEIELELASIERVVEEAKRLEALVESLSGRRTVWAGDPEGLAAFVAELRTFPISPGAEAGFARTERTIRNFQPTGETLDRVAELVGIVRTDLGATRDRANAGLVDSVAEFLYQGGEASAPILAFLEQYRAAARLGPIVTTVGVPIEAID